MTENATVKQCCAAFYGSDVARKLLGDSFHPGGTRLTQILGERLNLKPSARVLDVASGRGTSAFYLAESFHCTVIGVDFSAENVAEATNESERQGLSRLVQFVTGDAERLLFSDASFDAVICECALCTFPNKRAAAAEFFRVLKQGGSVGISDLTRVNQPLPDLEGLLAWIACIGDALPTTKYAEILEKSGFRSVITEHHTDALTEMVHEIQGRLLSAEVLAALQKIDLAGVDFAAAKRMIQSARQAIADSHVGYVAMTAQKL
ncbi:MAG: methyltransferase domain-containing protein [Acidobacteriaceae bacterium]